MKTVGLSGFALIAAAAVTGCVPIINKPDYPTEWAHASSERIGACPVIAGTYANKGRLYIEAGIKCPRAPREGSWSCDLDLAPNLGIASQAFSVAITQPDGETMNVGLLNESGVPQETQTLRLNKDYQCDAESVYLSSTGSMVMGKALSGALFQHRRAFSRDAKGELVMTVRDDLQALIVFIGVVKSETSYVRWMPGGEAR
jgi:hypothetical protein